MPDYPHVTDVSDAAVSKDRNTIYFALQLKDGKKIPLECDTDDIGKIIDGLLDVAVSVANQRTPEEIQAAIADEERQIRPIPALGFAIVEGPIKTQARLVFHLGTLNLAFDISASVLKSSLDEIGFSKARNSSHQTH